MKANQQINPIIDLANNKVIFDIADGQESLVLNMDKLHPDIIRRAALVGMAQVRIIDAAAIGSADKDGTIIPRSERLRMKRERMEALIVHYESGTAEWTRKASGGGTGGERSITIQAIARVKSVSYAEAEAMVQRTAERAFGGDTKKALAHLRTAEAIAEAIRAIRAERTTSTGINADDLLGEME